jgi:phosphatidylserine decarboxylase
VPDSARVNAFIDSLFVRLQRLLPTGFLGRLAYAVSRWTSAPVKNALIRLLVRVYSIDITEAARPVPEGYSCVNAFFTRELKPGCRPVDTDTAAICSPADGYVQQLGQIRDDRLMQVKGIDYTLDQLLGADMNIAARYRNGAFLTIYLAPHNYHRVHDPVGGAVREMVYVPGQRLAVNQRTARVVPGLFATNERLLCHCDGQHGHYSVILVGAMNVACISTAWQREVLPCEPKQIRRWTYDADQKIRLKKGDYLGQFELGSTVIVLMPPGTVRWDPRLVPGSELQVGQRVGTLL